MRTRKCNKYLQLGSLVFLIAGLFGCGDNAGPADGSSSRGQQTSSAYSTARGASSVLPAPVTTGPIEGGIRGRPWGGTSKTLAPLEPFDFIQEEYFYSSTAEARDNKGNPLGSTAGFTSRLLVQRPRLPENFNGTVLVEWFNVTGQMEQSVQWAMNRSELLREGYAYVGVSVQETGMTTSPMAIKTWDPVRYAPLSHPGDAYEFDIMSLAARALFAHDGPAPLGDLVPQRVIAAGQSQSAALLISYANRVHSDHQVFDGFFIHSYPGPISADVDVPVLMFLTEAEMEGLTSPQSQATSQGGNELQDTISGLPGLGITRIPNSEPPSPDANNLRVWEIAGASHFDQQGMYYSFAASSEDSSAPFEEPFLFEIPVLCGQPMNQLAMERPTRAALHALNAWMLTGHPPATVPRIERNEDGSVVRDADGLAQGGLRVPPMLVPVGVNTGHDCILFGSYTPYSDDKIRNLYPTRQDYEEQLQAAVSLNLSKGWLLPPEAVLYLEEALQVDVWSD